MLRRVRPLVAEISTAAFLLAGCGPGGGPASPPPAIVGGAVRVSGASPFAPGCSGAGQGATDYVGTAVEPALAADPSDPLHLVGVWQQDRWSDAGANGLLAAVSRDGGRTWSGSYARFTRCTGGDYQRGSDPWVAISAAGIVHQLGLAFDAGVGRRAILASRSLDGGATWSEPVGLQVDTDPNVALDKPSITADPVRPPRVYAVWDRLTGVTAPSQSVATGPAWFARSPDDGASWEAARPIYDPGSDAQTIGNLVVVLPDGTLLDVFTKVTRLAETPEYTVAALRSADGGDSWSTPIEVAKADPRGVVDPKNQEPVRTGDSLVSAAVDPGTGTVYVAWEDSVFSGGARDGIALAESSDGGASWSAPRQVNGAPLAQAFTPILAAAGTISLTYYDLRLDSLGDASRLLAAAWLATSADGGLTWRETELGAPFNLRAAANSDGYFLGDYEGLAAVAGPVGAFFVMTNDGSAPSSDVFFESSVWAAAPTANLEPAERRGERPLPAFRGRSPPREQPAGPLAP